MSVPREQLMAEAGDDARICAEGFGDRADPAVLLLMGQTASMLWWPEELCAQLAGSGLHVLRYDNRDTGLSTSYEPGKPGYGGDDLARDAVAVLDAFGVDAAHLVGVSMGGGVAQVVALRHPDRVLSLALISTGRADEHDLDLPGPSAEYMEHLGAAGNVDYGDREARIDFLAADVRELAGDRPVDEAAVREFLNRDFDRSSRPASLGNHDLIAGDSEPTPPLDGIGVPTLVVHGTADPLFPFAHGEALADAIPGARLLKLEGGGHGLHEQDWGEVGAAIAAQAGGRPSA